MSYKETSREAYDGVQQSLSVRHVIVFHAFKTHGNMTHKEVSKKLDWAINCVTPRVGELVKLNVLEEKGKKIQSGRNVIVWGIK